MIMLVPAFAATSGSGGTGVFREFRDHALIDRALKRHDQAWNPLQRLPPPRGKFRHVRAVRMLDVDFAFLSGKAHCKPFLRLSAIFALPGLADQIAWNVVAQPFGDFTEPLDRADVGFLAQLAQRGPPRILAGIDAALRHLPGMSEINVLRPVDTLADKRAAVAIEQHNADAETVGQIFNAHCDSDGLATADTK